MRVRSALRSWHMLWPTRARRRLTSPKTRTTRLKCTQIRPSTTASMSTRRRQGLSMKMTTTRALRTLNQRLSWGLEEARSMGGTILATASSTRPLLPLSQTWARSTNTSIPIRPRPETSQQWIVSLQVIPILFVVPLYLHILALQYSNIVVKYWRPRSRL